MNKIIIFTAFLLSMGLIHGGYVTKISVEDLKDESSSLQRENDQMKEEIKYKESLIQRPPILLSTEYGLMINQIRILESDSGTSMNIQLVDTKDTDDIADHYEKTGYQGIRGLAIKIVINKFSNETDMGAVLDDVHLLEKNTDFLASEIVKDNNDLIVKGELYGL